VRPVDPPGVGELDVAGIARYLLPPLRADLMLGDALATKRDQGRTSAPALIVFAERDPVIAPDLRTRSPAWTSDEANIWAESSTSPLSGHVPSTATIRRSSTFRIFPVAVMGISFTTVRRSGSLKAASPRDLK
jgi:hypothetical protein